MSNPIPPTPEAAVRIARQNVELGKGIGHALTELVLQALDTQIAEVVRLQAIVDGDTAIRDSEAYRLARQDADEQWNATPPVPTPAPPPQGPVRAELALARIKTAVKDKSFKARKIGDPPGPATIQLVVAVNALRAAIEDKPAPDAAAPPAGP